MSDEIIDEFVDEVIGDVIDETLGEGKSILRRFFAYLHKKLSQLEDYLLKKIDEWAAKKIQKRNGE